MGETNGGRPVMERADRMSEDVYVAWPTFNRAAAMAAVNRQRRTRTRILKLRRATDPGHGTMAAYQRGCGCATCRIANMQTQRAKRRAND